MSILSFLLGEKKKTASVAKERLQIILAHERSSHSAPADYLPALQREPGGGHLQVREDRQRRHQGQPRAPGQPGGAGGQDRDSAGVDRLRAAGLDSVTWIVRVLAWMIHCPAIIGAHNRAPFFTITIEPSQVILTSGLLVHALSQLFTQDPLVIFGCGTGQAERYWFDFKNI